MKKMSMMAAVCTALVLSGAANASPELAQANCSKCHDMDKKKKGPSYRLTAGKYKGQAGALDTLYKSITDPKGDHPELKSSPEDTRAVLRWILTL